VSEKRRDLIIQRILVAIDASRHSLAALEAGADLAAHLEAELVGLFVEDTNLLRLAELPFAQEVGTFSANRRWLDPEQVERQLRAQAERTRRALAAQAERTQVHWSFEVTRGIVAAAVLTAAAEADLVILGRASHGAGTAKGLGSTARAVVFGATCTALVISQGRGLRLPVLVLYDGSRLGLKALAVAAGLVRGEDLHLVIFVLARGLKSAQRAKRRAADWLEERDLVAHYRIWIKPGVAALVEMIQRKGCGTLVLPAQSTLLDGEAILTLLDELDLPTLLVR